MKTCVYTYLIGSYDGLLAQPVAAASTADFLCFTDDPSLRSDDWEVVLIEPRFPTDTVRSARALKILGHERLRDYDATLCIDASVRLKQPPESIIADWLGDDEVFALAEHSYREQLLDEFDEVVRLNYDNGERVHEQLLAYSIANPDCLTAKPLWTGMMARRRDENVDRAMQLWYDHVLRFSRRDQLSILVALAQSALPYRKLTIDNFGSDYHEWPVINSRKVAQGKASPYFSGPLLAEVRRAKNEIDRLSARLEALGERTVEKLSAELAEVHARLHASETERERLEAALRKTLVDVGTWHERWSGTQGVSGGAANFARSLSAAVRRPFNRQRHN
ncbi:glycosyltransferase domain-containing protein [Microbacterium sp. NPDC076911]|uniref:glycosyltransferase domain-containing protein n=1 Tax=Microbacterium sp. NPDC076911 TaxID=3154958 RepID=UPI003434D8B9